MEYFIYIGALCAFGIYVYALQYNRMLILRDRSKLGNNAPFSLSRTQLAFWTGIILVAFFVVWHKTNNIVQITDDVLALLGISGGTTLIGSFIDKDDLRTKKSRIQDENNSGSFFHNILSDSQGLSMHRLQLVVFHMAVASYFLFKVFKEGVVPDLNENLMVLLGISSATYLGLKKSENSLGSTSPTPSTPPVEEPKMDEPVSTEPISRQVGK